jgi:MFS family permease
MGSLAPNAEHPLRLGLRANAGQFALLVLVNAFVGGMVGLERTLVPLIGSEEFKLTSTTLIGYFVVSFGLVKAFTNLFSGALADTWGRRPVLIIGWLLGLPVPWLIMYAPSWSWIVAANILLGLNQGFAWSMTVVMKVDLVGPSRRGLAMGINEFSGYLAVGITAFVTGMIATSYGLRPQPFYLGVGYSVAGLLISQLLIRETRHYARHEADLRAGKRAGETARSYDNLSFGQVFKLTSWKDRGLFAASQAGLANNFNDGMSWVIFPLFFATHAVSVADIGLLKAVYPAIWGLGQLITGPLSDRWGRKGLIVWGMWVQALGHVVIGYGQVRPLLSGMIGCMLLGIGTAMVYPTLLASVGDMTQPTVRTRALSVYRFWRDLGYAIGAFVACSIADQLSLVSSIHFAGFLTFVSGVVALWGLPARKTVSSL